MKKLLSILGAVGLSAAGSSVAISCNFKGAKPPGFDINRNIKLQYGEEKVFNLTLKEKEPKKDTPIIVESSDIKIVSVISNIDKDTEGTGKFSITLKAISSGDANITIKYGEIYEDTISVKVGLKDKIDLSTIENKDLGKWSGSRDYPSDIEIVEKLNKVNLNLNLDYQEVEISAIVGKDKKLTSLITALETSINFKGNVTVTYEYSKNDKEEK
ncbi:lipoprotein [Spiroplasma tabanidicola]|uniref:Lipoprotein n=1 Tax=Spiroplasma tabanidicola TaxID=324079 RepID=A0A6I6CBB1_9MOLU|nr:lipoprotein [Spiroplasma tabanidicola]QGS51412.1 hypothetical protein STABA_v1c00450 [Spiroplasma tabanidicola]